MKPDSVTLAAEIGEAMGKLACDVDIMAELYVELQSRIGALEVQIAELSAPRPKRSRAPRRRLQVLDAIAAE
jgi:hypothetical protein